MERSSSPTWVIFHWGSHAFWFFFFLPPFHRNVCIQTWRFPPWAYQISTCSCNATGLHSIQLWKQFLNTAPLTSPHLLYSTWHFHGHLWKETLWPWRKPRWRLKENEPSEGYSSAVQGRLFKWHHEARAQRRRSPLAQAVITGIRCFVVWMSLGERFALLVMAFEGEATDVEKQREELKHIFARQTAGNSDSPFLRYWADRWQLLPSWKFVSSQTTSLLTRDAFKITERASCQRFIWPTGY